MRLSTQASSCFATILSSGVVSTLTHNTQKMARVCRNSAALSLCCSLPKFLFRASWYGLTVVVTLCRYAGAGLFDSVQSTEPIQTFADYSSDVMCNEQSYQQCMLAAIGLVSLQLERLMGTAQDIEGVIDHSNAIHIVQTRPQV